MTDIIRAMNRFFQACFSRMKEKYDMGWTGWDDPSNGPSNKELKERLIRNVEKGNWVDVANLGMMLWFRERRERKE